MSLKGMDRRTFALAGIYGLWAVMGAALALPAAVYLFKPPKTKNEDSWIEVGDLARLKVDSPEEVVFRRKRVDGWKVVNQKNTAWVVKKSDKEVVAFSPQCTHLGCAYTWLDSTNEFLCPCHTSTFALDGRVLTGPAPRPLDRMLVKIEGSKIMLGGLQTTENV